MNEHRRDLLAGALPDVAGHVHDEPQGTLDWVGMSDIAMPVQVLDVDTRHAAQAAIQLFVNLGDSHAKGIHMSRLYRTMGSSLAEAPLTPNSLASLLLEMRATHEEISTNALIEFAFELLLNKPALVSDNSGWNRYPIRLRGELREGELRIEQEVVVHYSSTCPASAALARSVIQEQFTDDFKTREKLEPKEVKTWLGSQQGIVATPHGQRSAATVKVQLQDGLAYFPIARLIQDIEDVLGTPVQTAVKREDEQEFARRNGQNPMFCEDSARRIKQLLLTAEDVTDFLVHVEHFESLHAHNAVSMVAKGVPNGFRATPV
ncbi:MAG: GTP cyclohydrolase FolE2 [Gammaproteobacteria bacterium]|nr:GTP cyclohydrolase FolE2 [Gammaproteobacteria bacterium]